MRRIAFLLASSWPASLLGHSVVDLRMGIDVPGYVARGAAFTYELEVENPEYDFAYGVTMEATLPDGVTIRRVAAAGWNCSQSRPAVQCSAEEVRPGRHRISVEVSAPTAPGSIRATATVSSLGVFDPTPANDTARSLVVVYEPSACIAVPPLLDPPRQGSRPRSKATLTWSPVAGALHYDVYLSVEKEQFHVVAQPAEPAASLFIEGGEVEWFVEAVSSDCPPARSPTLQFRSTGAASLLAIGDFAGIAGRSGSDDGPVSMATFSDPVSLAIGNEGEMYVAEREASTVRRIRDGLVTTFIGRPGVTGSADGDSSTQARLRAPAGVAASRGASGLTLYVADTGNQTIRQAFPGVYVSTVAGVVASPGHRDGLGAQARFASPAGLAHDNHGTLYIADTSNHAIRYASNDPRTIVQLETKTLAGVAGTEGSADGPAASALFRRPTALAIDAGNRVYVADSGNHTVRRIDPDGTVTTLAGVPGEAGANDGTGSSARFDTPSGLAVDALGNLFVCDSGNHVIRKVSPSGRVTTVAGLAGVADFANGIGAAARFREPAALVIDSTGTMYIADRGNRVVRRAILLEPATRRRTVRH